MKIKNIEGVEGSIQNGLFLDDDLFVQVIDGALNKSNKPSMLKIVEKLYGFIPIEIIAQYVKWTLAETYVLFQKQKEYSNFRTMAHPTGLGIL